MNPLGRLVAWWRKRHASASIGERGEAEAARFLVRLGYRIVARGDRTALGEIDLVVIDKRTVVFVEVKTRESHEAGHPAEAVDLVKQQRLTRLGLAFLKRQDLLDCPARFDVVAITWGHGESLPRIEHFINAFEAVGRGQMYS